MINYLKGTVIHSNNQSITVLLNQNIGLNINISSAQLETMNIGTEISLFIYMHWNQENGPSLYGFTTEIEKKIFELVISCSGIGPKIGLAVLSCMNPEEFVRAISQQDIIALSSINGIGAKKAEQIIVQLKHKIDSLINSGLIKSSQNDNHIKGIIDVLTSLNYSRNEIIKSTEYLRKNFDDVNYSFDQMLKNALSFLSKKL